jgi:hypothetical protein
MILLKFDEEGRDAICLHVGKHGVFLMKFLRLRGKITNSKISETTAVLLFFLSH